MNIKKMADELELPKEEYVVLVKLFVETSRNDIERLVAAISNRESEKAAQAAHSIKGAAVNLELTEVSEIAKKLEMEAREGNLAGTSSDILLLKKWLNNIESRISV
jgi:HPt (histidine-containing phosphotransfer) domain-containing protein